MGCQKEHTAFLQTATGHLMVICQRCIVLDWTCRTLCWKVTSPITKFLINFCAIACSFCLAPHHLDEFPGSGKGLSCQGKFILHRPARQSEADLMRAKQRVFLLGCFGSELVASWQQNSRGGEEGSRSQTHSLMALPQEPVPSSSLLLLDHQFSYELING